MRLLKITIVSYLLIFLLAGCNQKQPASQGASTEKPYEIYYAKGFKVEKYTGFTEVSVVNPWDTTKLLQKYILVDRNKDIPAGIPQGTLVKIPVKSAAVYNTLQCSTLNELESADIIKGVFEPQYVKLESIKTGVLDGSIENLGEASKPDVEKLIMLSPEAILASPIVGQTYGNIGKTNIPIIEIPDYTESHPLGRAEWIRFYSLFIGKEELADSLFNITVNNYNDLKSMATSLAEKPTVFTDTKYQSSWNMPGGKSYMANMLADAGGAYIWAGDDSSTFLPLSFEAVLDKAGEGDIWLIRYFAPQDMTYESLKKEYKQYSYFKAFKNKNIYGCNTTYSAYFEDLAIHPDYILKDFIKIFHSESIPDYDLKYYKKVNE